MEEKMIIVFDNYLRDLYNEIINLEPNQSLNDFITFFKKDEVFTIGYFDIDKKKIKKNIDDLLKSFGIGKKLMILNLDDIVQDWNETVYLIQREKSLQNYFFKIIFNSIIAKKFYYEKIGKKDFTIDESFYIYDISHTEKVVLISNNNLLLKYEVQRNRFIDKYIYSISKLTSSKKERKSIPKKIRDELWFKYFGYETAKGYCYVCNCELHMSKFEAGHVISDAEGGDVIIDNLRPICSGCNKSMGNENLYEYRKKYYNK